MKKRGASFNEEWTENKYYGVLTCFDAKLLVQYSARDVTFIFCLRRPTEGKFCYCSTFLFPSDTNLEGFVHLQYHVTYEGSFAQT